MKTEQQIESQITPEIIKKMCELAEGFELHKDPDYVTAPYKTMAIWEIKNTLIDFSLLIHRAVEGWNEKNENIREWIEIDKQQVSLYRHGVHRHEFKNYQPETRTACELACLDCLIEVLK